MQYFKTMFKTLLPAKWNIFSNHNASKLKKAAPKVGRRFCMLWSIQFLFKSETAPYP